MPLFTSKADAGLSILTRLYQVSPDIGKSLPDRMSSEMAQFIQWWLDREKRADMFTDGDVMNIARLASYVRPMMESAADRKAAPAEVLQGIEFYIKNHLPPPTLEFVLGDQTQGDSPVVRFGPLGRQATGPLVETLTGQILTALVAAWERATFRRCEECRCPFPTMVKSRRWCSQRCRARAGERRRYAVRMEGYPVTNKRKI